MDLNNSMVGMILTSSVIASIVNSIINIIIACKNNRGKRNIESEKQRNELIVYRYSHLYEILLKWQEYEITVETENKSSMQICHERALCCFFDAHKICDVAFPLLDKKYRLELNALDKKCENLCDQLFKMKRMDNCSKEEYDKVYNECLNLSMDYKIRVKNLITIQLDELLTTN